MNSCKLTLRKIQVSSKYNNIDAHLFKVYSWVFWIEEKQKDKVS